MRVSVIFYECDWCHGRAPAIYPSGRDDEDAPPERWKEIDHSMLCAGCVTARAEAIDEARFQRLNKDSPRKRTLEDTVRALVDQKNMPGASLPLKYINAWRDVWAVLQPSEGEKP